MYGNVNLDFSKLHDEVNNAIKSLKIIKKNNEDILEKTGFNKELEKFDNAEKFISSE